MKVYEDISHSCIWAMYSCAFSHNPKLTNILQSISCSTSHITAKIGGSNNFYMEFCFSRDRVI